MSEPQSSNPLVQRLRKVGSWKEGEPAVVFDSAIFLEAADAIERVERERDELSGRFEACFKQMEFAEHNWGLVQTECETRRTQLERLERWNMCDACAGTGEPISGKPCMCGGSGKASDALQYLREEVVRLEWELANWRTWGVIEVAIRNPNVSSYMDEWEGRTIKAEAERDRLRAALERIATGDVPPHGWCQVAREALAGHQGNT